MKTARDSARRIIDGVRKLGVQPPFLYDLVDAFGSYADDSSKGNEKPTNRRPRVQTRERLMRVGELLTRWARYCAGRSEKVAQETAIQAEKKLTETVLVEDR